MNHAVADDAPALGEELLAGLEPLTYFQPICSIKTHSIFGAEALARGMDAEGNVVSPAWLFAEASRLGVAGPYEMACRHRAIAAFSSSLAELDPLLLFMNLNLAVSDGEDDAARLLETTRQWSVPPQRIVVEVLESRFDDTQRLAAILNRFRELGFLLALDDVGAGHSNLDRVPLIQPDVLKVDRELVRHLDSDYYKQGVFKALVGLGRRIGALIVAEGVETEPEALTALALGADLLQGFYVSRPQPPQKLLQGRTATVMQALAERFKQHMVAETSRRRHKHRQYNVLVETLLCDLTCSPSVDFNVVLQQAVRRTGAIECAYVLDETGIQVSETACRPNEVFGRSRRMFRPAPVGADHSLKEYYYMLLDAELPKYTTDPYVSLASGNLCQTISTCFRDGFNNRLYVLCVDVKVT
jgi:EAL domain-containing protein (putative c-di-GMP-specific phosphodiesterase class I)